MLETRQRLNHLDGVASLLLVQCRDINAGHHLLLVGVCVVDQEYFTVAFAVVK